MIDSTVEPLPIEQVVFAASSDGLVHRIERAAEPAREGLERDTGR